MRVVSKHPLRRREAKNLLTTLNKLAGRQVYGEKEAVELVKTDVASIYLVGGEPAAFELSGRLVPFASSPLADALPKIVVDAGAVPRICNGADVMAPGVVNVVGDFEKGSLVAVVDERHGKVLAVAEALEPSAAIAEMSKGKVAKNLHYVGDKLWRFAQEKLS